jgi:hypothetical protein
MRFRFLLLAMFGLFLTPLVQADVPSPNKKPPVRPPMPAERETIAFVIVGDPNIRTPELRVPKKMAGNFAGTLVNGGEIASGPSKTQTIVGGAFLSLAVIAGGLWLVRSRMPRAVKLGTGAALVAVFGLTVATWANKAPPWYRDQGTLPRALLNEAELHGRVAVVMVDSDDDTIRLVIPKSPAAKD